MTTNHQGIVEWEPYATTIRTCSEPNGSRSGWPDGADVAGVVAACLSSPLYASRFHEGFGTLYTAEYRPAEGIVRYHWPDRVWEHSIEKVSSESPHLHLGITGPDVSRPER